MGLDKVVGILLIWFVIGSVLCIMGREAFHGKSVAVGFFAWLTVIIFPTILTVALCYGVSLLIT